MTAFRPRDLAEALRVRLGERAVPLAGGTDLMVGRWRGGGSPAADRGRPLVFIGHLPELRRVDLCGDGLRVGAACTLADLLADPRTPPPLAAALAEMAAPAIRNVATIGGNVCHASPGGDTLPWLYAAGADLVLRRPDTERRVSVAEFITGPGRTTLAEDELLTDVCLPAVPADRWRYRKVGMRRANSLAKLSVLLTAATEGGRLADVRIAFGAVAPTVVRRPELEVGLRGWDQESLAEGAVGVAEAYGRCLAPIDDARSTARYRHRAAVNLLAGFLREVLT